LSSYETGAVIQQYSFADVKPMGYIWICKGAIMPYFRNFTYYIDKRRWKYYFLLATLAMDPVK